MTSHESKIIQWKKLYQLISGTFYNESQNVIKTKLFDVTKEIQEGLSVFKNPSPDDEEKLKKLLKEKQQSKLIPFTQKLMQFLNIDVTQCYDILCYYLVNEYRGSSSSLQNFVSSESLMIKLLSDIWFYYSLERMVLLKVTKCLLEYYNSDHPYQEAFKEVIDKIGFDKLRKSYIEQFEVLVKDVQQVKFLAGDVFTNPQRMQALSERKHREINEVLQIILLTCHYDRIKPDEIERLVELFKFHSFGKHNQFLTSSNSSHADLIQKVTYNEIALLIVILSTANLHSLNWMTDVVEKLDDQVTSLHHYPEHGPILLSWMLFKFAAKSSETTTDHYGSYGKLGSRAVQLNVFEFLYSMMKHKMFTDKSLTSKIVAQCIYENLSFLCELFNADGSISQHPKVYELFSEILKSPTIAKDFCKTDDNPIRSLFTSALEKFPCEFLPLSLISQSLASASKQSHRWIVDFVQTLPIYTEQPTEQLYELEKINDEDEENSYVLLHNYQPFKGIADFIIPAGTRAIARDEKNKMFIHFFVSTNYFDILHHEINEVMSSIMSYSEIKEDQLQRLRVGIKFLATIMTRFESPNDITNAMIHPTEMVFDILSKLKSFQTPSLDLMAVCIDVCSELVGFFGEEIFRRFVNLKIAPSVSSDRQDFKAFANGVGFESAFVGYFLINIEQSTGRYNFLRSYLNFLKTYSKLEKNNVHAIELPGLIFVLREVLVHAHTWRFENEQDKMDIFLFVFEYLHDILAISHDVVKGDPARKLLRDVCVYSLLNLEQSVALLKHVGIGNPALLSNFIENETNWFAATDSNLNLLVLNAMRILMQVLRLKNSIPGHDGMLMPLEQLIYTQPKQRDTLKIIPIVTSYTTFPFNRRFAVLTCRLLRRFAIEFQSSLSACIDMEPDQLRMMFLQRLRDDLESEDLKIAVLDFVISCIDKQSGLTEAFFKVTYEQDKRNQFFIKRTKEVENMGDGILTYMEEYLEAIEKDPTKTTNVQLKKIMSLFHALWKQGLQSLVKDLVKKNNFWSSLCSPLMASSIPNYQYSQLFNILGIELFKIREVTADDENFKNVLVKFLDKDAFNRWLELVFDLPTMDFDDSTAVDETPEWLSRLQSFKDFLVILLKRKLVVKMPSESIKMLMDKCLEALLKSAEDLGTGADTRPFVVLAELFLVLLNDQKVKYTNTSEEDATLLISIESLLKTTTNCYNELHKRAKDSIISIAIKTLDIESDEIQKNPEVALSFVRCNAEILCIEFFNIENQIKENSIHVGEVEKNFSVILALNLMKKLVMLQIGNLVEGNWIHWFNHHKIFNRLLSFTSIICQVRSKRLITAESLDLLALFAKGPDSKELIYCDLGDYLWMKLTPPKELLENSTNDSDLSKDNWTPQEWWIIYEKGIQLVKILLEKHSHLFIKDALFFVGIHEEYLTDCLMLAKTSLEENAIKLIKATQELLCEVVRFDNFWRVDYFQSIMSLMTCIQSLLDTAVSLLHRPKILKRLTEASKTVLEEYSDTILTDPSDELVNAMNELIEIITLCCKSLLQFSPKLLSLLCDVEFYQNKWTPFIKVMFGAPKINANSFQQLSFGTVLSAIAFFVKVLNLTHHTLKQMPLNQLPNEDEQVSSETVSMFSDTANQRAIGSPLSPRRPFSKSLSMNSVSSSIVQASNELLSHLDSKACFVALEFMLTLLASQSLLALKSNQLSSREKQLIRRELSNELYCLHDYVKKKILKDSSKSTFIRQKLGAFSIVNTVDDDAMDESQSTSSRSSTQRRSQDLRVNVVRKLHLQQKTAFEIPSTFSPILQHHQKDQVPMENTPLRSSSDPFTSTTIKRVGFDLSSNEYKEDEEPFVVNRGDPSFTGLSYVKMIEEDYLHLLSNLFMSICQSEN